MSETIETKYCFIHVYFLKQFGLFQINVHNLIIHQGIVPLQTLRKLTLHSFQMLCCSWIIYLFHVMHQEIQDYHSWRWICSGGNHELHWKEETEDGIPNDYSWCKGCWWCAKSKSSKGGIRISKVLIVVESNPLIRTLMDACN